MCAHWIKKDSIVCISDRGGHEIFAFHEKKACSAYFYAVAAINVDLTKILTNQTDNMQASRQFVHGLAWYLEKNKFVLSEKIYVNEFKLGWN